MANIQGEQVTFEITQYCNRFQIKELFKVFLKKLSKISRDKDDSTYKNKKNQIGIS